MDSHEMLDFLWVAFNFLQSEAQPKEPGDGLVFFLDAAPC